MNAMLRPALLILSVVVLLGSVGLFVAHNLGFVLLAPPIGELGPVPFGTLWVVPCWIPFAFGAIGAFGVLSLPRLSSFCRLRAGLCVKCGYDLRGSPGACPECGHE